MEGYHVSAEADVDRCKKAPERVPFELPCERWASQVQKGRAPQVFRQPRHMGRMLVVQDALGKLVGAGK